MKISVLINDLKQLKKDHGDMDLVIHVDDGKEDYVISSCGRFTPKGGDGIKKYQAAILGIHKRDELLQQDLDTFADNLQKEIERNYFSKIK